jgi:hypothetical protein
MPGITLVWVMPESLTGGLVAVLTAIVVEWVKRLS